MDQHRILIVDDDEQLRTTVAEVLRNNSFAVGLAVHGLDALEQIKAERPDLVMLDVDMPQMNGMECLLRIKALDPSIIVIIMTAYSSIEDAVRAIKEGAYNYLAKPIKHQAIVDMVERALEAQAMVRSMAFSGPVVKLATGELVGSSAEMQKIFNMIYKLSKVDTSVLIRGESGTGKELVARAIHYNSARKDQKLVTINCTTIPETLFESELFGHEKGAFTGADQRQIGKFQFAEGGTIFLDEIGELPLSMQVKLLRVLQERRFSPVGSNREIGMDVRIIAATNRNLEEMVKRGTFREDLFYRLNVIPIYLPPLRERTGEIERLVSHFISKFNTLHASQMKGITMKAIQILLNHQWPGNIRELENVIEHCFVIENTDQITHESLPEYLHGGRDKFISEVTQSIPMATMSEESIMSNDPLDFRSYKEQFERQFIISALKKFKGKVNQTAIHANIPKKTLLRKLSKYKIRPEEYK